MSSEAAVKVEAVKCHRRRVGVNPHDTNVVYQSKRRSKAIEIDDVLYFNKKDLLFYPESESESESDEENQLILETLEIMDQAIQINLEELEENETEGISDEIFGILSRKSIKVVGKRNIGRGNNVHLERNF